MKVYVAERLIYYEGGEVLGVFSTLELAEAFMLKIGYERNDPGFDEICFVPSKNTSGLGDEGVIYEFELNKDTKEYDMGDYTKLIIHAEVKCTKAELLDKLEELRLGESAYHCDGVVEHIEEIDPNRLNITLVGQTKYGQRQQEFLDWIKPKILQGSTPADIYALQFSEYSRKPTLYALGDTEQNYY